jgi:hypothetical protein
VIKYVLIYPSDPNQILQITFYEYQNEIIQLQKQIIEFYQIFKMLRTGFCICTLSVSTFLVLNFNI